MTDTQPQDFTGTDLTTAELLEKGAAYLEEVGLHQGDFWPGAGADFKRGPLPMVDLAQAVAHALPVCALGSLKVALGADNVGPPFHEAWKALDSVLPVSTSTFNDTPGRTAGEVADAMRSAATEVREAAS